MEIIIIIIIITIINVGFFFIQYLYNLDPNSAYYDPKTRSMRQNPFKETDGSGNKLALLSYIILFITCFSKT